MKREPGREYPEPNEKENTDAIIRAIRKRLERDFGDRHVLRQFHAKMHACIKAVFRVDDNLIPDLQAGIFKAGKSYDCWIRFSNGNTRVLDDRKADLRGMAVKLLNVEGEQLVADESMPGSHDFLLVSHPTLMSATVRDFRKNIVALCNGLPGLILFAINPFNWGAIARTFKCMNKHDNLFSIPYWSMSPYRFGRDDKAVKYKVQPTTGNLSHQEMDDENLLSKRIVSEAARQNITFDFLIQFQENPDEQLIEDPTREWKTSFKKIATVTIPKQVFDPAETKTFGDNLSFHPWHCTEEHRPLGAINRARKETYREISDYRRKKNISSSSRHS